MRNQPILLLALILSGALVMPVLSVAATTEQNPPRDRIEVVSHFPMTGAPVDRLLPTRHYGRRYLYAEQEGGKVLTVIDVTNAAQPFRVADVAYPPDGKPDDLVAVAGTAALVASPAAAPSREFPQSVRIVSFRDPAHPKVTREFTGVTAMPQ